MCFATAALIAGGVGAATSAGGTILGGISQGNAANYNAQIARNNATVATQNATYAEAAGAAQGAATSQKGAAKMGAIKAAQAASGVDVNSGSPAVVQESERDLNRLDTENVISNANLSAYGYRTQATNYTSQAGLESTEAEEAPIGADIGAAGGLLSSASSLGLKWTGGTGGTGSLGSGGMGLPAGSATGGQY